MLKYTEYVGFGRVSQKNVFFYNKCVIDCVSGILIQDEILKEPSQIDDKPIRRIFLDMSHFFEMYEKKIGMLWMEYFHEKNDLHSRENEVLLISVEVKINNRKCSYPIGIPIEYIYNWPALVDFITNIKAMQKASATLFDNVVALSPYSTGIFVHEVIGHISEVLGINCSSVVKDGIICDIPIALMDYGRDDSNAVGIKVNIPECKLTDKTGNSFCGISNQRNVVSLIRQRNLVFYPSCKTESIASPIMPVFLAGVNSVKRSINMIAEVGEELIKFDVPLNDIMSIRAINKDKTDFIGICHKQTCPHYFGVSVPWSEVIFLKKMREYIGRTN